MQPTPHKHSQLQHNMPATWQTEACAHCDCRPSGNRCGQVRCDLGPVGVQAAATRAPPSNCLSSHGRVVLSLPSDTMPCMQEYTIVLVHDSAALWSSDCSSVSTITSHSKTWTPQHTIWWQTVTVWRTHRTSTPQNHIIAPLCNKFKLDMQNFNSGCQAQGSKAKHASCNNLHTRAVQPRTLHNCACRAGVLQPLCAAADTLHPTISK